jgi:hypothetical protein
MMRHLLIKKQLAFLLFIFASLPNARTQNIENISFYGDLIMTPIMAYTISDFGSNIPTHFLLANGVKANIGFELGFLMPIFTHADDAKAFLIAGTSRHLLGYDYGGSLINLGAQRISNHRHNRYFFGIKFVPFDKAKYFTVSATAGYGNILANYSSKNINGLIQARTADFSLAFAFGLSKFVFK